MSITEFDHTLGTFGLYPTAFMCVIPVINTSDRFRFDCLRVHVTQALIKQTVDLSCSAMKANSVVQENRFSQRGTSRMRKIRFRKLRCCLFNRKPTKTLHIDPLILKRLPKQLDTWGYLCEQQPGRDLASTNLRINPLTMCTTCPSLRDWVLCFYIWHTAFRNKCCPKKREGTCFTALPEEPAVAWSFLLGYAEDERALNLISFDNCKKGWSSQLSVVGSLAPVYTFICYRR